MENTMKIRGGYMYFILEEHKAVLSALQALGLS
jgi:hypothetical protein